MGNNSRIGTLARHRAQARLRERLANAFTMTPDKSLAWLLEEAGKVKYGANNYIGTANLIRRLLQQRADLNKELDSWAARPKPAKPTPPPQRSSPEGNGQWDLDWITSELLAATEQIATLQVELEQIKLDTGR